MKRWNLKWRFESDQIESKEQKEAVLIFLEF